MNLTSTIRTLTGAALVALAVAGMTVTPAGAETKGGGGGDNLCAATGATLVPPSDLDYEFFVPGELATMKDPSGRTRTMECGKDGTWRTVYRRPWNGGVVAPTTGGVYAPASGGVYTPSTGGVYAPKVGGVLAQP